MKKYILILLLFTGFLQAQTYPPNPTPFGKIAIKANTEASTATKLNVQETDGQINWLQPINLPIPYTSVNYSSPTQTIGNHLSGIDTRLGQISSTSAGVTQRVYFTADNTTVTAGTFYTSSITGKGTAPAPSPAFALVLADNTKGYFNKDLISIAQPSPTIGYAGTYSGNLTVSATPTPVATQQRFTIEIYRTDNGGTPIASGVSGAPVGDLGVTVLAILDSGIINLAAGSITNIAVSGVLTQNITLNTGERLRYHVSAAKIGTGGGNVTFGVYYGTSYNSYYDVPVAITTDAVLNKSAVTGITDTDALNTLNNGLVYKRTISQIRALTGTLPSNNFYTTDSGQEGNWYYDSTDTTTVDNTGTVLVTADGKRIKRIVNTLVYPEWFGAKGDGTTDDTSALQSSINSGYKVVINKNKTFLYSATLVLGNNTIIEGLDNQTSILKPKIDTFTFRNNFNPATIVNSKAKLASNSDDFSDPNTAIKINNLRVVMSSDITSNMQSILRFSAMIGLTVSNCTFLVSSTTAKSHNSIIDLHASYRDVLIDGNIFDITTNSITSGGAIWVQNEGDVDCEKVQVSNNVFNVSSKDETLAIYTINGLGQVKNARAFNNTLTKPVGTTSPSSMLTVFGNVDNVNVYRNYLYSNQASGTIDGMIRIGISSDATNTGKPNNVNIEFNKVVGVFTTSKGIIGYSGNVVKLKGNTVISTDLAATTNLGIVTPSSGLSQNWIVIGNEVTNFSTAISGGSVIESNIITNAFIGAISYRKITDNVFNSIKTRCVQLPALGNTEIYEITGNQFNTTNTATDVIGFATGTIGMGKTYIGQNIFKGTTGGTITKGITQISGSGTTGTVQEDNNTFTLPGVSYDITVFNTLVTSGNLAGLANVSTARNNLGLGSIATQSSNSVTIGGATKYTIFNGTTFFSNVTPVLSISPISPVSTTYEELFVTRSPNNSASAVLRRLGHMFKLSDESSNTESLKSGGIMLESSLAFANQPSLSLVIGSLKGLTIDFSGNSLFSGVVKGSNGVASNDFVTKSQLDAVSSSVGTSGTYTPTAVAGTNVTSVASPTTHTYTKIGNIVTVYGYTVPTLTTTAIDASYTITLPIARANTGTFAIGFGATDTPANTTKSVFINSSTTTTATIMLTSTLTGGVVCRYSFQYDVTQ